MFDDEDENSIDDDMLQREIDRIENNATLPTPSNPILQNISFVQQFTNVPSAPEVQSSSKKPSDAVICISSRQSCFSTYSFHHFLESF